MMSRSADAPVAVIRRARPLLGTLVDIRIAADGAAAAGAIDAAFAAVERVHRLMSFHAADSDLSRLNRSAHERPVRVDPWTFEVLSASRCIAAATGGAF